jgi:glycosyltransferase involved in cell wall biosynthesis
VTSPAYTTEAKTTCCIIPMYNEEKMISEVIIGLRDYFPHILCVDDGSSDNSGRIAEQLGVSVIRHAINIGQGAALATGFRWVLDQNRFDFIITFDADGQHVPNDALRLLEMFKDHDLDVVFASRFLRTDLSEIPLSKRIVLRSVAAVTKALTDVQLSDAHNGLRAIRTTALRSISLTQNGMAHATQLVSLVLQAELKYTEVPVTILYTPYSRSKGQSILNSVNIALELIWGQA